MQEIVDRRYSPIFYPYSQPHYTCNQICKLRSGTYQPANAYTVSINVRSTRLNIAAPMISSSSVTAAL